MIYSSNISSDTAMSISNHKFKSIAELRQAAIDAHQNDNLEDAKSLYRVYLQNKPKDAAIWSNFGALLRKQKNYVVAAAAQSRALELDPASPSVMNNAANAFYDAGYLEKSLKLRKETIKHEPNNPDHHASLGKSYRSVQQLDKALKTLAGAIKKFPDFAELHIQLAFVQLAMGDYSDGFKNFDWRWLGDELNLPEYAFPKWKGQALKDKTILVLPEQGFGDTVLMARFLPELKKLGMHIKMAVKPPLQRLFSSLQNDVEFIQGKAGLEGCDYWVPMMDLPLYLNATLDTLPQPVDLFIPQDAIERARKIVAPFTDRFKIGVMWSGSVTYRANHKRSFSHRQFLGLCDIPGIQMFSLYKGPLQNAFVEDGTSAIIIDASCSDRDFADSAALMQELDLVISMDSAIVHVAGSLGIEVWNLLHAEAYWLYQPFPDHTPWYPSMRLIRQQKPGDWDHVFDTLKADITTRANDWKKP
jgi:Tfp pilus assembly protein PilF